MNSTFKNSLAPFALTLALLATPALRAGVSTFAFPVLLNTATLNSQDGANAPFDLDFQLNGGNGAASYTASIGNFSFVGGAPVGGTTTAGVASGNLGSSVSLTAAANSANELFQQFSAATSQIQFTVTVSLGAAGSIPTQFTAAILDNSLGSPAQLFTSAPDTLSLVTFDLGSTDLQSNVGYFTSVSSADGNTAVVNVSATVPEPSTTAALFGCAAGLAAFCVRRFGKRKGAQAAASAFDQSPR